MTRAKGDEAWSIGGDGDYSASKECSLKGTDR